MPQRPSDLQEEAAAERPNYLPHAVMSVRGLVWKLAKDADGCRALQQAFEEAGCDDVRVLLASELQTHVWDAMKCDNANHVLQKCIGTMRPMDSQFIIDELVHAGVAKTARHRHGCRVLQRLYELCAPDQMRPISEDLVKDALPLCRHIFAKYVMQHLIEHGSDEHVAALTQMLALHAPALGADGSAYAAIGSWCAAQCLGALRLKCPGELGAVALAPACSAY